MELFVNYLTLIAAFATVSGVFLIVGSKLKEDAKRFDENKQQGTAQIIGHTIQKNQGFFRMRLMDANTNTIYWLPFLSNTRPYPVGSTVSVVYGPSQIDKSEKTQVYFDKQVPNKTVTASRFIVFGYVFLVLTIICFVVCINIGFM